MKTTLLSAAGAILMAIVSLITHVITEDRVKERFTEVVLGAMSVSDCEGRPTEGDVEALRRFAVELPEEEKERFRSRLSDVERHRRLVRPDAAPLPPILR